MQSKLSDITSIIIDTDEVNNKLEKINLTQKILIEACQAGVLAKSNSSFFDTKGQPGYIQWNDTNSRLRILTHNKDWEIYQENGIEGIISKDKKTRIIPSSGNAGTGNPNVPSSNKNPKGIGSIKLFENCHQLNIFTNNIEQKFEECETYILLYYSNDSELSIELSIPSLIDSHGKIKAWKERIILPKQPLNDPDIPQNESNETGIDIPVIRKQVGG